MALFLFRGLVALEVLASSLELTALRVFKVSSEILAMGTGVSQPLGGSEVTLIRDMASRKSVWLTVIEGALIVRIPEKVHFLL